MISAVCRIVRESMSRSDTGILFHVDGPSTEKSRSPNFRSRPY